LSRAIAAARPTRGETRLRWALVILLSSCLLLAASTYAMQRRGIRALNANIRATYGLVRTEHDLTPEYFDQMLRRGMTYRQVNATLKPLSPWIRDTLWHTGRTQVGAQWVTQTLVFAFPGPLDYQIALAFGPEGYAGINERLARSSSGTRIVRDSALMLLDSRAPSSRDGGA
jgi:hypothetical protein